MSIPILKNVDFGSVDLTTYQPDSPDNFCVWLNLLIGPDDAEGGHLFQVGICTVAWLAHQVSIKKSYVLRHMILVENFDYSLIEGVIRGLIESNQQHDWEKSVPLLSRLFAWEFEDFQS